MDAANGVPCSTLSDFEATLRQVEDVLGDFGDSGPEVGFEEELEIDGRRPAGLVEVLEMLVRAHVEIGKVGSGLRELRLELRNGADRAGGQARVGDATAPRERADNVLARAEERLARLGTLFDLREIGLAGLAAELDRENRIGTVRP